MSSVWVNSAMPQAPSARQEVRSSRPTDRGAGCRSPRHPPAPSDASPARAGSCRTAAAARIGRSPPAPTCEVRQRSASASGRPGPSRDPPGRPLPRASGQGRRRSRNSRRSDARAGTGLVARLAPCARNLTTPTSYLITNQLCNGLLTTRGAPAHPLSHVAAYAGRRQYLGSAPMDDQAPLEQLRRIDHIVVVMMENRSFDHMLGYLSLPHPDGTAGRTDIDGLRGPEQDRNHFNGKDYPIAPMGDRGLTKLQDPCHSGWCVGEQMANAMSGFVANYATTRAHQDPGDVMRYQTGAHVPFYDFLADEFAVLDRWFCSVPGSTWPNRVSALTGQVDKKDNQFPPLYMKHSFVRSLPRNVSWRWYSSDPGSLRLIDDHYRTGHADNFAYVEKPSLVQPHTFFTDVMAEELPNVSWIDPNFVDLGGLQGADDDHPPTDVMAGQSFLLKIYSVL